MYMKKSTSYFVVISVYFIRLRPLLCLRLYALGSFVVFWLEDNLQLFHRLCQDMHMRTYAFNEDAEI